MDTAESQSQFAAELDELLERWADINTVSAAAICGLMAMQIRMIQDDAIMDMRLRPARILDAALDDE